MLLVVGLIIVVLIFFLQNHSVFLLFASSAGNFSLLVFTTTFNDAFLTQSRKHNHYSRSVLAASVGRTSFCVFLGGATLMGKT